MPVLTAIADFRSDTVTKPTPEMRRAMTEAEVGDDVYGDDPTVNRLQETAAAIMGKEAGLFVPSGTMGNALALTVHTQSGDEALMDSEAHSMIYEVGMPAVIARVLTRQFRSVGGVPDVEDVKASFHEESLHSARTSLLVLENTHNRAGGAIIPLSIMRELQSAARERGAKLHLDGARLFNAAIASGIAARDFAACADTVTFCLSKGLGCPIGSVLCGSVEFISRARRVRKMLGGGMRQAGILAAAGLYALEHHIERLADDHANAQKLAAGIKDLPGVALAADVPTNMVYFNTTGPAEDFTRQLFEKGVSCLASGPNRIRMVTHLDINAADVEKAIDAIRPIAGERG